MTRVRAEVEGPIGRITLARPEKKNALDRETAIELARALEAMDVNGSVRAVCLGADGTDFCAGADLEALELMINADAKTHLRDAHALGKVFTIIRGMGKPVVAVVQGRALAGGAGLATACDIVLAHEGAQFGYPEVRIGFVPAMVMTMLRRSVGEKRAFDLVATGRVVPAREALELGLVSRVFSGGAFQAGVDAVLADLVKAGPDAMRLTKRLFYDLDDAGFIEGIELGAQTNVDARATEEFKEGVRRFVRRSKEG
ncbi:MAG: enoyl-CoA hydratase-related protein [Gemmatimonadota bacterium]|nr:enoyl-CoA hydratase-related protein [Gemmatimonadota bacterium]